MRHQFYLTGLFVFLSGCAPSLEQRSVLRSVPPPEGSVGIHLHYLKMDAGFFQQVQPDDFEVRCDTPGVQVVLKGVKSGFYRESGRTSQWSIVLAMDQSASLQETDPTGMRFRAAQAFLEGLPSGTQVGLVCFASLNPLRYGAYDLLVPPSAGGITRALQALQALEQADYSMHGTPIWNTLWGLMHQELAREPSARQRWIVCFTDGKNELPTEVVSKTPQEVLQLAQKTRTHIAFVVLGDEQTIEDYPEVIQTLREVAEGTGGSVTTVEQASELEAGFRDVGRQMGYLPSYNLLVELSKPGGFSRQSTLILRVRVKSTSRERAYRVNPTTGTAEPL